MDKALLEAVQSAAGKYGQKAVDAIAQEAETKEIQDTTVKAE
ncbi:MAG: hypothetical protein AB8F78_05090 [Saprospiraceae bacterium]